MFEHIPNAHALQFWAPNSYMIIFEHDFRDGPLDFGGFSSKVRFFRRRLQICIHVCYAESPDARTKNAVNLLGLALWKNAQLLGTSNLISFC